MGLPYQTEDYDEVGATVTVNNLDGMNFSSIQDNEMLKKVDADNVGGSDLYSTSTTIGGNQHFHILYSNVNNNQLGSILFEQNNTTYNVELRPNPYTPNSLIVKEDGTGQAYVGINVLNPQEALDVEGNLQLQAGGAGKIFFKHPSGLKKVELDGDQDATNGGKFIVKTKEDGGSMTEKLTIDNAGDANLGLGNMNIAKQLTLGSINTNQAIINLQDFTNLGTTSVAEVNGFTDGLNGGKFIVKTKENNGSMTEKLTIDNAGLAVFTGSLGAGVNAGGVGYMKMGTLNSVQDEQAIAHSDHFNANSYALRQKSSGGEVSINTAAGSALRFRVGNVNPPELLITTNFNEFSGYVYMRGTRAFPFTRIRYDLIADTNGDYWVAPENNSNVATTTTTTLGLRVDSAIYGSTYYQSSDDRRKHNELKFADGDGLQIINKLQPLIYEKTDKLYEIGETRDPEEDYTIEAGFIAQEVLKIPELAFAVRGGDYVNEEGENVKQEYSLDYQSIWTVAVKAIQDLSTEITQLKERIAQLEA